MSGYITKTTILCHPFLIASLFGWKVVAVGLVSKPVTFLDLLRTAGKI